MSPDIVRITGRSVERVGRCTTCATVTSARESAEAAFVINLTLIILKVAERLVRAGADVCR